MSRNPGYLVEYLDFEGKICKGICFHSDQTKETIKIGKLLVTKLDEELNYIKNDKGELVKALKDKTKVTIKGFSD